VAPGSALQPNLIGGSSMSFWSKKKPPEPVDWRSRAAKLPSWFASGSEFQGERRPIVVTSKQVGVLRLPSGRIFVGEPDETREMSPLHRPTPKGDFPFEISLATVSKSEARIAAARVLFSQQPIASWEIAAGGGAIATAPNGTPGFAGTKGIYMDAQTAPSFVTYVTESEFWPEWWYDVPFEEGALWQHACFQPDEARPETCVIISAGAYDGVFVSYWALDARGEPISLVTDFNVIP
jgi:hypothetical protein